MSLLDEDNVHILSYEYYLDSYLWKAKVDKIAFININICFLNIDKKILNSNK